MTEGLILAIDQGTTNTKALLVGESGTPVFRASAPVSLIQSPQGFLEQDPLLLWESVLKATGECVGYARATGSAIEGIGISNQRETAVAWNAITGMPVANAVSWQCGRGTGICQRLASQSPKFPHQFRARTGLPLAPLVSACKWAWLLENEWCIKALAGENRLRLGTVDSWLIHQLTRGAVHATDFSNASRTGLLNLETLGWDSELLETFGIPQDAMPSLKSSAGRFGTCTAIPALDGVPVLAAIGDSHAAMFGHGCYAPGTVKATYGTGSSLMALTSALIADTPALARTIAWALNGRAQFALEGNIPMTGAAVQWVGEFLHLPNPAADAAGLAATVETSGGVYFVPAMVGLGAPYWDAQARGAIVGLGRAHTSAHLARAALDAIAYQVADVFFTMEQAMGAPIRELYADGGATRNESLMQFQADILGRAVLRSSNEELSALGATWLAGLQLGWWSSVEELAALPRTEDVFPPGMSEGERVRLYGGWANAVHRTRSAPEARA
jgi:glycerol kinase